MGNMVQDIKHMTQDNENMAQNNQSMAQYNKKMTQDSKNNINKNAHIVFIHMNDQTEIPLFPLMENKLNQSHTFKRNFYNN